MTDHTHSTLIPPDSVPMTSSANKEFKTRKGSDFSSHKSNNPNTDFMYSFIFHYALYTFSKPFFCTILQTLFLPNYSYNQFTYSNQIKKQIMNQQIHAHQRDISSSQDHCRCEACKNQDELKNFQRPNPTNIYISKHLKKRGVPPFKKELLNKDLSRKAKHVTKKEEMREKLQTEKTPAIPTKHKLIQVLRSKQTPSSSFFADYHQVSHSQREKLPSKDAGSSKVEQPRRISNMDEAKSGQLINKQLKPKTGATKLVEISENPEHFKLRCHNQRSMSQASANHNEERHQSSVKSLEKAKL